MSCHLALLTSVGKNYNLRINSVARRNYKTHDLKSVNIKISIEYPLTKQVLIKGGALHTLLLKNPPNPIWESSEAVSVLSSPRIHI